MRIEPYRLLFPLGATYGILGALLWTFSAFDRVPYPGAVHHVMMIQGFETCFIAGFLLTALPAFTHSERCHPVELVLALAFSLGFAAAAVTGSPDIAQACFALSIALVLFAGARRVARGRQRPPLEMLFVLLGLLMGLAGSLLMLASSLGVRAEPEPRFGLRLVSLGMVLSLVLGVGGLLVPTFIGVPRPLEIPGIAAAHERRGRLPFYLAVAAALVAAFALEGLGRPGAGAWLRALAATAMLFLVWKLHARPARNDLFSNTLRAAGWCVLIGLWLAALLPLQAVAAWHFVFIGGFGLLTLGIATRVVAAHGGQGLASERRLLTRVSAGAVVLALAARVAASLVPALYLRFLAASGLLWTIGWLVWVARATPMLLRTRPALPPGPARAPVVQIESSAPRRS